MGSVNEITGNNGCRSYLNRRPLFTLLFGVIIGFTIAIIFISSPTPRILLPYEYHHHDVSDPHIGNQLADAVGPEFDVGTHGKNDEAHALENTTIAKFLEEEVRVLCWVMTSPSNHRKKARHVQRTWGKRCNKLLFMSSTEDDVINSIALPVKEGRNNLWAKTKEAFKYIYNNHINDADWFLKADDDTYVIVENLRYMLYQYSSKEPIYFGCKFKTFVQQGYMSGGAGYVLSKDAVIKLVENGIPDSKKCRQDGDGAEDVEIGKCLENVHVKAGDSRDSLGRGRFFPFVPEHHLIPGHVDKSFWYWKYIFYETNEGLDCCSDNAISFHYVSPNQMYVLDYLIYHLRPYGIFSYPQSLPPKNTHENNFRNNKDNLNIFTMRTNVYTKGLN